MKSTGIIVLVGIALTGCSKQNGDSGVDVSKANQTPSQQKTPIPAPQKTDDSADPVPAKHAGSGSAHHPRSNKHDGDTVTAPPPARKKTPEKPSPAPADIPDSTVVISRPPQVDTTPVENKSKNPIKKIFDKIFHHHKKNGADGTEATSPVPLPPTNTVVGFGSETILPSKLAEEDLVNIVKQGNSCFDSGYLLDQSRCYVAYGDGHSEWLNIANRPLLKELLDRLSQPKPISPSPMDRAPQVEPAA